MIMNGQLKRCLGSIGLCLITYFLCAQSNQSFLYESAFHQLDSLASSNGSFRKAVIITETTYDSNYTRSADIDFNITYTIQGIRKYLQQNHLPYRGEDSNNLNLNFAIFHFLKDTIKINTKLGEGHLSTPFTYDFNDFAGNGDWRNMFVSKLLITHLGNCHSLPYFYKILADELGATCWLSLAPNHMYIKNRCKGGGWYNTELTSGTFPIDAWVMASGYITLEAVQNGIYMDTLSNQQSIALCILDLAKGYEHQAKNYYDGFIIKCCDLSLQYFPRNVQAMLLKAETLKRIYEKLDKEKNAAAKNTYSEMEQLYIKLLDLGYREMPDKMYQKWLLSIQKEKTKYNNRKVH